ncbi:MAG: PaaI family thioesterase [Thermoguttaceae bacterium]
MLEKFKRDRFAMHTGIEIVEFSPGYAKTKLEVKENHLNAVDIVQGGAIFTLADFAFAVAGNQADDEVLIAVEIHISYLKPTKAGTLFAEAREVSRTRNLAYFEIPVTNENDVLVAKFCGRAFVQKAVK